MKEHKDFTVLIERNDNGEYIASVPELVDCCARGKTVEEVQEKIKEMILLALGAKKDTSSINLELFGFRKK